MVFISHAWINGSPDHRVLSLVNTLRENGYEAKCDVMITQEHTSIHFQEMMAKALKESDKTIIVLSENYKKKSDNFTGGVGEEYRYIIEDFKDNPNKYILVSFVGRDAKIVPDFLRGRDIVDLSVDETNDFRDLLLKLSLFPRYEFSPVATHKTIPAPEKIESLNVAQVSSTSNRLGLNFETKRPVTDLQKKTFLKASYEKIIALLKEVSYEFCTANSYFQIECEKVDENTSTFYIYKNGSSINTVQIWLGNMMGSRNEDIFISNSTMTGTHNRHSWNEMIVCKEVDKGLFLEFTMNTLFCEYKNDGTVESITSQIWERFFESYLRMEY